MPIAPKRRIAAPLLILAGAGLFGLGAGGIAGVDAELAASTRPALPQQMTTLVEHRSDVRGDCPHPHGSQL